MPTYAYRCKQCSYEFEEFQRITAEPLVVCPKCKKRSLVRIIGGAGLVFKGTGFYLTDYKKRPTDGGSKSEGTAKKDAKPTKDSTPKSSNESPAKS
jgi:putative FmdB family regulatory protein